MSPRPMTRYKPDPVICGRCGKPLKLGREPVVFHDGAYHHAVNCKPKP